MIIRLGNCCSEDLEDDLSKTGNDQMEKKSLRPRYLDSKGSLSPLKTIQLVKQVRTYVSKLRFLQNVLSTKHIRLQQLL